MNREDIIRMARETGCWETDTGELVTDEIQLGRFAALVAFAERERLTDAAMKAAEKAVDVAIALEREACAKVCEQYENDMGYGQPQMCADAIRARGQA